MPYPQKTHRKIFKPKILVLLLSLNSILAFGLYLAADYGSTFFYHKYSQEPQKLVYLEAANFLNPETEKLLEQANAYEKYGQTEKAIQTLRGRREDRLKLKLEELYLKINRTEEAKEVLNKISTGDQKTEGQILLYIFEGNRDSALESTAALKDKQTADCYRAYLKLPNTALSCFLTETFLQNHNQKMNPDYLDLETARFYLNNKHLSLAEGKINELISENPRYRDAYILAVELSKRKGDRQLEEIYQKKVEEIDPVWDF